ncbi:MAG: hypothetical protein H6619_03280 [Deltaproteobacteria bacterium]|nr:hypothetical protein [Deltaproteobacteria bacterium]
MSHSNHNPFSDVEAHKSKEMLELIKRMSLEQRADRMAELCEFAREMQIEGIKLRNPGITKEEAYNKFKEMMYAHYAKSSTHE